MDHLFEQTFSEDAGSPQESFRRRLDCAKQLVLKGDAETRSRRDIRTSLFRASRHSSWLADQGLISIHKEQEMAMVCFFWEFGELFDLNTVFDALARSVSLLRNLKGTFLELYLEPDYSFSKLMDVEGYGIFSLPEILMNAPPLVNRYGEHDNRQKEFRNQRWEVPLIYLLCGVGLELYRGTASAPELLDTLRASLNKLSFLLQSSMDAGLTLFMLDSFLLDNDVEEALPGLTMDSVKERLAAKSYASLHTAAQAACISQADINARCIQLLVRSDRDDIDIIGDDLLRSFSIGSYMRELENKQDSIIEDSSSQTIRAEILRPAYALHTFIEYRGMFDRGFQAIKIASEMEQHQSIFGRQGVEDAYKLIVNNYFHSNMLLYGTWQSSYAEEYLRFAGKLGFEVFIQTVATLPSNFPATHYSSEERHYIATECTKSVISLLVHKLGDRKAVSEMSKYVLDCIPEFSDIDDGINWARRMMKQANPIPMSIEREEVGPIVRAKLCSLMRRMNEEDSFSGSAFGQEADEESIPSTNIREGNVFHDAEENGITSQVEDGYDAEDSQDHSLTEDDDEPRTPGSVAELVATPVHVKRKRETQISSPEHPNANVSLQLDPGYDADSQGQTDIEEVKTTKKRKVETGYEGGESQGHSDEEEEEEEVSRAISVDENIVGSLLPVLAETVSQRLGNLNGISHARDETPSDGMSAADELTSCHDDDIGAESSEIDEGVGVGSAVPMNVPTSSAQSQSSVLVQYATEAQQNFLAGRLSLVNSSFATDDAVLDNASQDASIESMDLSEGEHSVADHAPEFFSRADMITEFEDQSNQPNIGDAEHGTHDASLMDTGSDGSQMEAYSRNEGSKVDTGHISQKIDAPRTEREGNDFESVAFPSLTPIAQSPNVSSGKRSLPDIQDDADNQAANSDEPGSQAVDTLSRALVIKRPRLLDSFGETKAEDISEKSTDQQVQMNGNRELGAVLLPPESGLNEATFRNVHDTILFPIREEVQGDAAEPQDDAGLQGCDNLSRSGDFEVRTDSIIPSETNDSDILGKRQSGLTEDEQQAVLNCDRAARNKDNERSVVSSAAQENARTSKEEDGNEKLATPRMPRSRRTTIGDDDHSVASSAAQGKDGHEKLATPRMTRSRRTTIGDDDHSVASSAARGKDGHEKLATPRMTRSRRIKIGDDDHSVASSAAQGKDGNEKPSTPRVTRSRGTNIGDDDHSVTSSGKPPIPMSVKKSKGKSGNEEAAPTPARVTRARATKTGDDDQSVASSFTQGNDPLSVKKSKGKGGSEEAAPTPARVTRARATKTGDDDQSVASSFTQGNAPLSVKKSKGKGGSEEAAPTPARVTRARATKTGDDDQSVASSFTQGNAPLSVKKSKGTGASDVAATTPARVTRGRAASESVQGRVLRSQKKTRGSAQK